MGREEPGDSHPIIIEWGGAWVVPSYVRVVWAVSGQPTYESQTFPTSRLPQIVSERQYSKNFLFGRLGKGVCVWSIFSICFELTRSSRLYLQGEIVSSASFSWGPFGHKVSELLSSIVKVSQEIWVAHGDLVCL
jgi:hypothetical protein